MNNLTRNEILLTYKALWKGLRSQLRKEDTSMSISISDFIKLMDKTEKELFKQLRKFKEINDE